MLLFEKKTELNSVVLSLVTFGNYKNIKFVFSLKFLWLTLSVFLVSCLSALIHHKILCQFQLMIVFQLFIDLQNTILKADVEIYLNRSITKWKPLMQKCGLLSSHSPHSSNLFSCSQHSFIASKI
jgi:hypothetical protein